MTQMKYTRLGNSGLIVSRLAFGTMTFNLGSDFGEMQAVAKVGQKDATEMVARALEAGVNFFNSADGYSSGDAERALGVALKGRRDHAVVCTKLGFRQGEAITNSGLSRRHIMRQVEKSLINLDTDVIDLLIVHKPDFTTPIEETLAALNAVVEHGKARYVGFSNWPAWQAARAMQFQRDNGLVPFIAGQFLYNMIQRDIERDLLPMMSEMGAGLVAWSPLSGGLLSGKYDPEDVGKTKGGRLADFNALGFDPAAAKRGLEVLRDIAAKHDCSVATLALAWILANPDAATVIVGASKMAHLEDALKAVALELTAAELTALNDAAPPLPTYPDGMMGMLTDQVHKAALQ